MIKYDDQAFDKIVVPRLKAGDESAFTQLYNYYHGLCFYIAFKLTDHQENAEDIVADVFMRIWNYREALPDNMIVSMYLRISIRNAISSAYRKKNSLKRTYKAIFPEVEVPVDTLTSKQLLNTIDAELNKLGVSQRGKDIFRLYYYEDIDTKEIARANGLICQTVRNHNHRITALLRSKLKPLYHQNIIT